MQGSVLIAEDEWITAAVLSRHVRSHGYEVIGPVGTGTATLDSCRRQLPDVVLMDIQMPEMDGLTATRALMTSCPVPVIVVTGNASLKRQAAEAGAMDYLMKPVLPRHLPEVIARARERFGRYQQVREGAASDEDALAIWVVVQAAVGMLVEQAAVSEPVAFERLRGRASTSERTLRAEAQAVFDAADEGGPAG